ncbi:hypothetical protein [Actinoplanes couchii]|uniref:DUF4190 domain-containing protein n=1 Tax=Actinoplanes couchii TaxID=403638 RepID=A0ABQ3XG14_9ACTN|nr:hypothetical protein [Actinoplanes couchii]MDR6320894.1 energy-coupling factor transporter transmembrane protein EcfT [Actinoplanes couchii]GID57408.1 hypothetical protein Aco03nite_058120 [Actinoplanes couchii]
MSHPTGGRPNSAARVCTIIAFVCAVIAVLFIPVLFGLIALILGLVAGFLGDRPLGWYAAAAGVGGAVLGIILAAAVVNAA